MADLEEHAIRRDHGFLVKLVLALALATLVGGWIAYHLTSERTAEAGARMMGYAPP